MTGENFSDSFDTLLNSYASTAGFGKTDNSVSIELDEFEKSLFLTQAQESYVLSLYNGKNPDGESFEQTEEVRRYLASLIAEDTIEYSSSAKEGKTGIEGSSSYFFPLPVDSDNNPVVWFITYEAVVISSDDKCKNNKTLEVYPVRQDEYHKIKNNPFRGANDRRVLRFDYTDNMVEIVSNYTVKSYYLRYLKRLKPIILENLADGLTIEGESTKQDCLLPSSVHQKILEIAVMMALRAKGIMKNNENR